MKTIKNEIVSTLIINKSKFITVLTRVVNLNEVNESLIEIKSTYKGATHYCYAYIIDQNKKASDDKEPSKTAGMPILNVLEKEDLNQILCVVIRYYGGIQLGTGGLVRAYTKSVTNALLDASLNDLVNGFSLVVTFTYDNTKNIDYILRNAEIISKTFDEEVTHTYNISFDEYELIKDELYLFANTIHKKENVFI